MFQLGGLDNLMVEGELPNIPLHMSAVMIYETGGKRGANRLFKALPERFERLIDRHFPVLRCRLEELPLHLDKAYWVEDADFSLAYHMSRVALPKPNSWEELYQLFGQFHAQPLDRTRPLWEILLVEGLDRLEGVPRGSTALFLKIHHALMDGKSALRLINNMHSLEPEPDAPTLGDTLFDEEPIGRDFQAPSWWSKYGRAWWHSVERPIDLAATVLKLLPQLLLSEDADAKSDHLGTPQTPFNHPVDPDRVVGHVRMEMGQLRRLEKKFHCTINDIALCVVAGALRAYLLDRDELPAENLQTLMPIDIRRKNQDGDIGNHLIIAKVSLHTSVGDIKERLAAISSGSAKGKQRRKKSDSHVLLKLVDEIHPAIILWLGQWLVSSGRIDKLPQTVNTVVTNVPGMSCEAYLVGAKLVDYLGFGPLAPNMGLFHTVSSTEEHVNISFLTTAAFMGDGSAYRALLEQSLAEVSRL